MHSHVLLFSTAALLAIGCAGSPPVLYVHPGAEPSREQVREIRRQCSRDLAVDQAILFWGIQGDCVPVIEDGPIVTDEEMEGLSISRSEYSHRKAGCAKLENEQQRAWCIKKARDQD